MFSQRCSPFLISPPRQKWQPKLSTGLAAERDGRGKHIYHHPHRPTTGVSPAVFESIICFCSRQQQRGRLTRDIRSRALRKTANNTTLRRIPAYAFLSWMYTLHTPSPSSCCMALFVVPSMNVVHGAFSLYLVITAAHIYIPKTNPHKYLLVRARV